LAVRAVRLEPGSGHPRVIVDAAVPASEPLDLFAEGPSSDWSLLSLAPLRLCTAFELDGLPPGISDREAIGARLRFTMNSGDRAIETTAPLLE
jgi:hypothetical protein